MHASKGILKLPTSSLPPLFTFSTKLLGQDSPSVHNIISLPLPHKTDCIYACIKGHLEPTHLKSSPLFTFSTKLLGQDSPSVHLFSIPIGSRFTTKKIKLGEDSPSWFVFLGQDSLSNKENNKIIKRLFFQDSPCFKSYEVKIHHVQR